MRYGRYLIKTAVFRIRSIGRVGRQGDGWIPFLIQIIGKFQRNAAGDNVGLNIITQVIGMALFIKPGFDMILIQRHAKTDRGFCIRQNIGKISGRRSPFQHFSGDNADLAGAIAPGKIFYPIGYFFHVLNISHRNNEFRMMNGGIPWNEE